MPIPSTCSPPGPHVEAPTRSKGRRPTGDTRARILENLRSEDPNAPLSEDALAAILGMSQAAVCASRTKLGLPPAPTRENLYALGYSLGAGLAQCRRCAAWFAVPEGQGTVACPRGHGRLILSSVRLEIRR